MAIKCPNCGMMNPDGGVKCDCGVLLSAVPAGARAVAPVLSRVVVTDVEMPFGSMVTFMIKWALASIPAFLVLAAIGLVVGLILAALFGGAIAGLAGLPK